MPVALEIALPNLLPVIGLALIDPALARIRQRPARARPVQVFPLTGPLGAGAVLEAGVPRGEVVRPFFGGGGEARVPDQVGPVDRGLLGGCFAGLGTRDGWSVSSGERGARVGDSYLGCGFCELRSAAVRFSRRVGAGVAAARAERVRSVRARREEAAGSPWVEIRAWRIGSWGCGLLSEIIRSCIGKGGNFQNLVKRTEGLLWDVYRFICVPVVNVSMFEDG